MRVLSSHKVLIFMSAIQHAFGAHQKFLLKYGAGGWTKGLFSMATPLRVAVVGGGASGYFSAIHAAISAKEAGIPAQVTIFESGPNPLSKVKISGGGRCNVLHDQTKPISEIVEGYPRGKYELLGPFTSTFGPKQTAKWFQDHGVALKTEPDGRMFPVADSSQKVIDCLTNCAKENGVILKTKSRVQEIQHDGERFSLSLRDNLKTWCNKVILATGSSRNGHEWAKEMGHTIDSPVPSLFTFDIDKTCHKIKDLAGISSKDVQIQFLSIGSEDSSKAANPKKKGKRQNSPMIQRGPILITHTGISGPAALKLSAFAARYLHENDYKGILKLNWLGEGTEKETVSHLESFKKQLGKKTVIKFCPFDADIPRRLWHNLVLASGIEEAQKWADVSKTQLNALAKEVCACELQVTGKGTFKDEFVTCGGVVLKEVNMKTMESKFVPGLHFCGEILNVDGITGGYNFQNAWTTGYIAGTSVVI